MEDSVAVVDAQDKVVYYRNLASVMRGVLQADLAGGKIRMLAKYRGPYPSSDGHNTFTLPGRSGPLVRNVCFSMYTDAVTFNGEELPEHLLDAMATAFCGCQVFSAPNG